MNPASEPIIAPRFIPQYTPCSPILNRNINATANTIDSKNSLIAVNISENVPFPSPWNTDEAAVPNGIANRNIHKILNVSMINGDKFELVDEYENINEIGSANT